MILATITAGQYVIKDVHKSPNMKNVRVIVPKKWDCDYVNVVLWEKDSELKISDPETYEFLLKDCGEILLKKVIQDTNRQYIYVPPHYDGQQVLIVPV